VNILLRLIDETAVFNAWIGCGKGKKRILLLGSNRPIWVDPNINSEKAPIFPMKSVG
jgi:hypothetical protein